MPNYESVVKQLQQEGLLDKYSSLKDDPDVHRLCERWGKEWFEFVFPVYLAVALNRAREETREPNATDFMTAYRNDMAGLKDEYKKFVPGDETLEVPYLIGSSGYTGRPLVMLFVTDKNIRFVDKSLMNAISDPLKAAKCTIALQPGEVILRDLEITRNLAWLVHMPRRVWLTNQRLLALSYDVNGEFCYGEAPLEPGEAIRKVVELGGVFLFTDRKLVHFKLAMNVLSSNAVEARVFERANKPSAEIVPGKKGFLSIFKAANEFRLSAGAQEVKFGLPDYQVSVAKELMDYLASSF